MDNLSTGDLPNSFITNEYGYENFSINYKNFDINENYCGNAIEFLGKIKTNSIPLILTDIPYGVVNRDSSGLRNFDKKDADVCDFSLDELINELHRVSSGS